MATDVRSKACSYLRAGKVTVAVAVRGRDDATRPDFVRAHVEGYSSAYVVRLQNGGWTCTCGDAEHCAHAAAVQLATGHPSLARKAAKS